MCGRWNFEATHTPVCIHTPRASTPRSPTQPQLLAPSSNLQAHGKGDSIKTQQKILAQVTLQPAEAGGLGPALELSGLRGRPWSAAGVEVGGLRGLCQSVPRAGPLSAGLGSSSEEEGRRGVLGPVPDTHTHTYTRTHTQTSATFSRAGPLSLQPPKKGAGPSSPQLHVLVPASVPGPEAPSPPTFSPSLRPGSGSGSVGEWGEGVE